MAKKNFNHVMIDIETLGQKPGCVILSIAAVRFNMKTGEVRKSFYCKVDPDSCVKKGLKIDIDTLKWWTQFEIFPDAIGGTTPLYEALRGLRNYLEEDDLVWSNGATFDLKILEAAYRAVGHQTPWKFSKERCVRTLASLVPEIKKAMPFEGTIHNPLDDCYHQIKYCSSTWNNLGLE